MTHNQSNYRGYTVISGMTAKNNTELKNKMDEYLERLMEFINEPIVDCPRCKGYGVILDNKKPEMGDKNGG